MRERITSLDEACSYCINRGVKIYPTRVRSEYKAKDGFVFEKNNWYIEIDNNGTLSKVKKSVATGYTLNSKKINDAIGKTYIMMANKIKTKEDAINQGNIDTKSTD